MKIRCRWRRPRSPAAGSLLRWGERFFLLLGLLALAYCALFYFQAVIYQAHEKHGFEDALGPASTSTREGSRDRDAVRAAARYSAPFGRIDIPRIGLSVMLVEGVASRNLKLAAGHVPGSAFPGEPGNVCIAGHRDTFFRKLREVRQNDEISITTLSGSFRYSVEAIRVVNPRDVDVLRASAKPILTLITCYPFYYVGDAPQRFIVRARQVEPMQ